MTSNSQFKSEMTRCRTDCEFCLELSSIELSRFGITYRGVAGSRLIDERDGFVVFPTIGQLFTGSLLILPRSHFETTAEMSSQQIRAALRIIEEYSEQLRQYGKVVIFEHGSRATEGRACGIYHAHVHVVPVPNDLSLDEALPKVAQEVESLTSAYDALSDEAAYLLFRDTRGRVGYACGPAARTADFGSQYFRRMLAARFGLSAPWDWRTYEGVEPRLLETLATLRSNVAVC